MIIIDKWIKKYDHSDSEYCNVLYSNDQIHVVGGWIVKLSQMQNFKWRFYSGASKFFLPIAVVEYDTVEEARTAANNWLKNNGCYFANERHMAML